MMEESLLELPKALQHAVANPRSDQNSKVQILSLGAFTLNSNILSV